MDRIATSIKNRLILRAPQTESLEILAVLVGKLTLQKDIDLQTELDKVTDAYPTCTDFERDFPSVCFALATGVGKTRLMGAFIAYLYLNKGIKNFFVFLNMCISLNFKFRNNSGVFKGFVIWMYWAQKILIIPGPDLAS